MVNDGVENSLMREVDNIKSCQDKMKRTLEQVNHQLGVNRNARHQIERDLANKVTLYIFFLLLISVSYRTTVSTLTTPVTTSRTPVEPSTFMVALRKWIPISAFLKLGLTSATEIFRPLNVSYKL